MKEIPLTQGMVALVDDEDFEELAEFRWFAMRCRNTFYAARNVRSNAPRPWRTLRMHTVIMGGTQGQQIDHKDRNGLNNQRFNLRFASQAQNSQNKKCRKDNKTQVKGVSLEAGKFRARIRVNGLLKHLGVYSTIEEAHAVYCDAAKKFFGEFAQLK